MTPVDALAAPIRSLLDSVGSGTLPSPDPSSAIGRTSDTLDATDARLHHAIDALVRDWESSSAEAAYRRIGGHRERVAATSDDGATIRRTIDDAAQTIRQAAIELRAVLDSFTSVADARGPALYTPAGVVSMIPVAAEHLARALAIVDRARTVLDRHSRTLLAIGRREAPGLAKGIAHQPKSLRPSAPHPSARHPAARGARTTSASTAGLTGARASHSGPPTPGAVPITLPDGSVAWAPNERAATAVRAALRQRGVPYAWGGTSPGRGLDCSGLTQYAYRQAGVELPRLAQDQDTAGYRVGRAELLPGDLAVWSGHVAMYVGNDQMIEAGDPVQLSPVRTTNLNQAFEGFYRPR